MAGADDQTTIAELIEELDGDDTNRAEEAQAELELHGAAVLVPLIEAAPRFGRFGQLCAIELLEHIGDTGAGPVLIPMLRSEDETVRAWATRALGELEVAEAVAALQLAYEGVKRRRTSLDWSEPQDIRDALTKLGARAEVVPSSVHERARVDPIIGRCWLPSDLHDVVESLAVARQVVLSFSFWERGRETRTWVETPGWELDWSLPWDRLVESARSDAIDAATRAGTPKDTVASVTWLDESDR